MKFLVSLFRRSPGSEIKHLYREWDRQRARAMSPSERSEIDAIFSRVL